MTRLQIALLEIATRAREAAEQLTRQPEPRHVDVTADRIYFHAEPDKPTVAACPTCGDEQWLTVYGTIGGEAYIMCRQKHTNLFTPPAGFGNCDLLAQLHARPDNWGAASL